MLKDVNVSDQLWNQPPLEKGLAVLYVEKDPSRSLVRTALF
ncbi:hypothetical protein TRIP_B10070 [uncultured Desulfatiglans sp.]|uniref:Uncharacterized protein n=1 Tax=Uncultured Desulfatiglans sp. TaxID=1748965 RepID=A0A653A126_UNCDX|nr:hypothetical protein TRIP_B10070 [uncultured Desulfatiglans sp.]